MSQPVHPETLFHLEPVDDATCSVIYHQDNAPFISTSPKGKPALEIGYHVSSRPRGGRVIARLGRGSESDLVLLAKYVAQVHIAFEVHPVSRAILLCVRSEKLWSVKVHPRGFRSDGDFRQLVLIPGERYDITIGDSAQLRFVVRWRLDVLSTTLAVDNGFQAAQARAVNLRWVKTEDDDDDSNVRSWYNTRLPSKIDSLVRDALVGKKLGAGNFGSVYRSIDLDSGHLIAVKIVKPEGDRAQANLHREINTLRTLQHPHIIDFFGCKGWTAEGADKNGVHIFMPLRTGSLGDLVPLPRDKEHSIISQLSHQMLSALDYLSSRNLCHRDVKPANILYDVHNGNFTFQLADFGLANHQQLAETVCGTRIFAAPELHPDYGLGKYRQTPKMDVWSLFVTLASVMALSNFDEDKLVVGSYLEILAFVQAAADHVLPGLEAMARPNPEMRASAAQILVKHFDGNGLTTNRCDVGPIQPMQEVPAPALAAPRRRHQEALQAAASPARDPRHGSPSRPSTAAGPSAPSRRWDATNRVSKAKSPAARQRERRSRIPGQFDSQEMDC